MSHPTLMSALQRMIHANPQQPLAVWGNEAPIYAEAHSLASVLARYFTEKEGLGANDCVLLSSPNSMGHLCAAAAVQACGARLLLVSNAAGAHAVEQAARALRPRIALVADARSCEAVRRADESVQVFSMGAPDVDAPSIGYVADQAIGLVDEVFLRVGDLDFDQERDPECSFADASGKVRSCRASWFSQQADKLASRLRIEAPAVAVAPVSFSTPFGFLAAYAALRGGMTLALAGGASAAGALRVCAQRDAKVLFVDAPALEALSQRAEDHGELPQSLDALVVSSGCDARKAQAYADRCGAQLAVARPVDWR